MHVICIYTYMSRVKQRYYGVDPGVHFGGHQAGATSPWSRWTLPNISWHLIAATFYASCKQVEMATPKCSLFQNDLWKE